MKSKQRNLLPSCIVSALITCILALPACSRQQFRNSEGMVWHTMYHITYAADRDLNDSIISIFERVGNTFNVFDPQSLASRVNAGDSVSVAPDFVKVYDECKRINSLTGGAFDPTLGPLITAWGFGKGHTPTADTLRIDSLLLLTGINRSKIEHGRLIKPDSRMQFNFSAIAKGYGSDCVGEMLSRNGCESWLVEIGGEIACRGVSPSGRPWRISIDRPVVSDSVTHESQCVIELTDCGLATSGNYRNFHTDGDSVFGHTISAKTGRPARTDVLSATVVAPTCMEADALATSMMALGSAESIKLADTLGYPVMLILSDMTVWQNDKFTNLVTN